MRIVKGFLFLLYLCLIFKVLYTVYVLYFPQSVYYYEGENLSLSHEEKASLFRFSSHQKLLSVVPLEFSIEHSSFLFVAIPIRVDDFLRRQSFRRTLFQSSPFKDGIAHAKFFVGSIPPAFIAEIAMENAIYKDIIILKQVQESFSQLGLKTFEIMKHTVDKLFKGHPSKPKFIMKLDDDTYVNFYFVLDYLKKLGDEDKSQYYYLGNFASGESLSPYRTPNSKYYISKNDYTPDEYPPFAHGPSYILSYSLVELLMKFRSFLKIFKLEDVMIGLWIQTLLILQLTAVAIIQVNLPFWSTTMGSFQVSQSQLLGKSVRSLPNCMHKCTIHELDCLFSTERTTSNYDKLQCLDPNKVIVLSG